MVEPVDDDLGGPLEDCQNSSPLWRGSLFSLAIPDRDGAVAAEFARMRVAGEVNRLQMSQFVEPQSVGVCEFEHHRIAVGRQPSEGDVEFEMGDTKFSLFERSKLAELIGREGGKPPCGEIGFLIEDVDGEAERLKELGVEILSGPIDRPWHERTLHIGDPDGNIIEFAQKLR